MSEELSFAIEKQVSNENFDMTLRVHPRMTGKQMVKQGKGGKIIGACSIAAFKPVCSLSPHNDTSSLF